MLSSAHVNDAGTPTAPLVKPSAPIGGNAMTHIRGLRWYIVALIFAITCINYIDRNSIGLLVTDFGPGLGITRELYGNVGTVLLCAYTLSQAISGRLFDRLGARIGFSVSVIVWCCAAMAQGLIHGYLSFAVCSFFLGLGEAGNWPGAAKVIAEWFPQRERATGMAIFNAGASMGGVLAPPLVARWLDPAIGWRNTFFLVGCLGFFWLAIWLIVYRPVTSHPRLTLQERELIELGHAESGDAPPPPTSQLLCMRQTWAILIARFLVDPVWWLYVLWLPTYLRDARHLDIKAIGAYAWVPYLAAAVGALFGGWLAGRIIRARLSVNAARRTTMSVAACLMPVGIFAGRASTTTGAIVCIAIVLFGFQMWISNVQTLPSDFFPNSAVGTVAGLGGMAAGISSILLIHFTAPLISKFGYGFILAAASGVAPIAALLLFFIAGPIRQLRLIPAEHRDR
jgi:ACS family hexuronate transporter-like MFS transporter